MRGGGGREEEAKVLGPLFPRLHVNDADKGGPRAPPRNKMALYEQLSIPLQRFSTSSHHQHHQAIPTVLFPRHNPAAPVPSTSASQGAASERAPFTSYYQPSTSVAPSVHETLMPASSKKSINTFAMNTERKSSSVVTKRPHAGPEHSQPAASDFGSSLLRARNLSNLSRSRKTVDDDDDFRVPTFVHSEIAPCPDKGQPSVSRPSSLSRSRPSIQLHQGQVDPSISKSKRNKISDDGVPVSEKESIREASQNSRLCMDSREKNAELSTIPKASGYVNHVDAISNEPKDSSNRNLMMPQESYGNHRLQTTCSINYDERQKRAGVMDGSNSFNPKLVDSNKDGADTTARLINCEDTGKSSDDSETSMVDSESGYDLSPDDVVGLVGPKHFWKARRAIINQQRVFAGQVFELHRLIKVQKLIAGSPTILLDGSTLLPRSTKTPAKRVATENAVRSPPTVIQEEGSYKVINGENVMETAPGPPPVASKDDLNGQPPTPCRSLQNEPSSGNPSPATTGSENRVPGPWCFHPSGNQWLMPVMSPSEGLIYKPVMGPYPPSAGFMGNPFGACGPLGAAPMMGDYMNMAYGIPASHQPNVGIIPGPPAISPGYFPTPYGVPMMNSGISSSVAQQVSTFTDAGVRGDSDENSRSSDNLPDSQSVDLPHIAQKAQMQRTAAGNLHGSTATSRDEGRAVESRELSLSFSMAFPASEDSMPSIDAHVETCAPRVIKVVPYNRRAASETAARIFQSIQEERLQIL